VDNHLTLALIAPRPLYLGTASDDVWANPGGEFLAAKAAEPVWHLLGHSGLAVSERPAPGRASVEGTIGFHVREGGHQLTAWDWARYLDFADRLLRVAEQRHRSRPRRLYPLSTRECPESVGWHQRVLESSLKCNAAYFFEFCSYTSAGVR
jgi:hypothetical protein